jgi:predicted transposase YbfD/YdcC
MGERIREKLSIVPDYRHASYVGHKLSDILIVVMTAVLCGLDQLNSIMVYAHEKTEFFARYFNISKIPSKPTMSRVLNMIKAEAIAKVIIEIMKDEAKYLGEIIAFDGKAIRSTSEKGRPHSALQILTAYMVESGVVLAQEAVHEKTNEIPIMRDILDSIEVAGKIVTADALHCQRDTCAKIVDNEHEGDYVMGLKENQKLLHDDVALFFNEEINNDSIETHQETELNGGRIERRTCRKTNDIDFLSDHEWPGLKTIFEVRRNISTKNGSTTSDETGYYISSLDTTAAEFLHISRAHWMIESMHWMLDADFSEDECELLSENGQKSLNIFRKLALFIHNSYMVTQSKKRSIKSNLLRCLVSETALLELFRSL